MNNVDRVTVLLVCLLADAGRALALLDYIAGDYQAALASPQEMQEQIGFAGDAAREAPEFASEIQTLQRRIESRAAPVEVAAAARNLALRVAQKYQLAVLPRRPPDVRRGRALYQQACAACHENARLSLSPPAPAFTSKTEVARLSPQRVFSAVTYGVPGTAMPEFRDTVDADSRWDLAFYVLQLAHSDATERARGERLLRSFPRRPDWLQLAIRSDDQLRHALTALSPEDREAIVSAVR